MQWQKFVTYLRQVNPRAVLLNSETYIEKAEKLFIFQLGGCRYCPAVLARHLLPSGRAKIKPFRLLLKLNVSCLPEVELIDMAGLFVDRAAA